jgi:hypothetical protein
MLACAYICDCYSQNCALAGALLFYLANKRDMARLYVNEKLKAA